jgi:signal transduction histidine kinase
MYFELTQYDSSLIYLKKAAEIGNALGNNRSIVHANALMGHIYIREHKLDLAQAVISQTEHLANSLNLSWEKANLALLNSELFFIKQDYLNSIEYGKKAIAFGKQSAAFYIMQKANNIVVKSFLHEKKINNAKQHVEAFTTMLDSLTDGMPPEIYDNIFIASNVVEESRNFETIKNELNIAIAEIEQRNIIILGTFFSVFLVAVVLFLIMRSNFIKTKNYKELSTLNAQVQTQKKYLEIVNRDLDNFNKEKDVLLGMVAHDIRSPLNKISGLINILKMENKLGPEHDHIVEIVEKTIKEANLLVNELLEINKLDAGAIEVCTETFDLSQFLNELVFFFKDTASLKNIELILQNNIIKQITTDKKYLRRILENLISNAIKYSEKNSQVSIILHQQNDEIGITVKDNGQGISEDEHKNLFMKFGKTSSIPTGGEATNGLGLYIVSRLTVALQGDISFTSKIGEGSAFTVHLPKNFNQIA